MAANAFTGLLNSSADRHSLFDDAQGIVAGSMLAVLGVSLLSGAGLLAGGTAGLAFLAHYATGFSFGLCFFAVNLPFYYLAFRRMGPAFTIKTFAAIALTSVLSEFVPGFIGIGHVNPIAGALFGGLVIGAGLALFRHRASLGGIGILALYIQDRLGWRAGLVQLGFDCVILALSFLVASPSIIACSVLGAVVFNLTLAINHRKDRYIAV
ncbi:MULTISPECIES: YitT family protein [Rhizobium]|uniref:YitT family protein n=1 Tax=Rhizobium TaxID=379 RepID=UPI000BE7D583|nr:MULTISPECIES: YitT family protein [Rhizobium]MBY4588108.1 YitT family protein [Rhizobium redzepovicii]MBY4617834.1 YitT family protein [Rhizobium redzepovicii]MDF0659936.1 YitT family protein [Rhizobium sp. BC49]PDS87103.1 membrane protein [Rhizobium sp. L18]TBY45064.1 YitT family protein [Rhizobium leguminosarum bv. viciae]